MISTVPDGGDVLVLVIKQRFFAKDSMFYYKKDIRNCLASDCVVREKHEKQMSCTQKTQHNRFRCFFHRGLPKYDGIG